MKPFSASGDRLTQRSRLSRACSYCLSSIWKTCSSATSEPHSNRPEASTRSSIASRSRSRSVYKWLANSHRLGIRRVALKHFSHDGQCVLVAIFVLQQTGPAEVRVGAVRRQADGFVEQRLADGEVAEGPRGQAP